MKFSLGYQLFPDNIYIDKIISLKEKVSEVYFSWGDFPNGRNNQLLRGDMTQWEAQEKQMSDLKELSQAGIKLNLLFNATCYGRDSQSRVFFEKIGNTVDFIKENYGLSSVTTTSPLIAKFIKDNFHNIDVRASVNMGVGTIEGMDYIKDVYDSFYLKRELNRDFKKIKELKNWCDNNSKGLYALANSGCLNNCSAHTFHDNLVSHESEISTMDNGFSFEGVCKKYLETEDNLFNIFNITSFIRPEDVYLYEGLFTSMKLATRVNANPIRIIEAYLEREKHIGSTLDLLEPNHTGTVYPYFVDNSRIETVVTEDGLKYTNDNNAIIKLQEDVYVNK